LINLRKENGIIPKVTSEGILIIAVLFYYFAYLKYDSIIVGLGMN